MTGRDLGQGCLIFVASWIAVGAAVYIVFVLADVIVRAFG